MRKILIALFSMIFIVSLVACGSENATDTSNNTGSSATGASQNTANDPLNESSEPADSGTSETSDTDSAEGKTLVVYFSATNNTKTVAGYIANATGGDLFEITPKELYTSDDLDWNNPDSRVCREHDDESLRNVELTTTTVENWDEYDTVFIGYPIWWGIAAWPTDSFVKANDFTGKTVIPFCTSSSSGLGQSGELLKAKTGTGNWLEGQRFQSRASEDTVKEWVNGLGL